MRARIAFFPTACLLLAFAAEAATTIATGYNHALAVRSDGRVLAWGEDSQGQTGQGQLIQSSTPVALPGLPPLAAMAAGYDHTLAVTTAGTVYAWGRNSFGQLGDGTHLDRATPAQVAGLSDVVAVAAGFWGSLALKRDGTVWAWGSNLLGQLGLGELLVAPAPRQVTGISNVVSISAGSSHVLALTASGEVWAWGDNAVGQLGDGTTTDAETPVRIAGLPGIAQVQAGYDSSFAITPDGALFAWGGNGSGELGDGTTTDRLTPVRIASLGPVRQVAGGYVNGYALLRDGTVWSWGSAEYGMLGDGMIGAVGTHRATPAQVPGVSNATAIAAGDLHALVVLQGGAVVGFGFNISGQLGDGSGVNRATPVPVASLAPATSVAVGDDVSFAIGTDGRGYAWGTNQSLQLAVARTRRNPVPLEVPGLDSVIEVAAGADFSLALRSDGSVWAWGDNNDNALGDNTQLDRASPVRVLGLPEIAAISAGTIFSTALDRTGRVWIWGGTFDVYAPGMIEGSSDIVAISCGNLHVLGLRRDGTVVAAGFNEHGQLGDGTRIGSDVWQPVPGLSNVVGISAGHHRSYAVLADGTVRAWGQALALGGFDSVLGDGRLQDALVPVSIGLTDIASIWTGKLDSSYAITRDGIVLGWGSTILGGSIGDGTTDSRDQPVPLPRLRGMAQVAAGWEFAVATTTGGGVVSWGRNYDGQVGDGTFATRTLAGAVLVPGGRGVLDLTPQDPSLLPAEVLPSIALVASKSDLDEALTVNARIFPNDADAGRQASIFVFALAPASSVQGSTLKRADPRIALKARDARGKATPVQCVLAQLNAQGQLVAVSGASLQAYASGVLSAQGQAVTVLDGVPAERVPGATFYVGYGPNGDAMLVNGTTRSAVSITGAFNCSPQAPQTGWWYNPAEGGRGFSIEAKGNRLFMAAFHYDPDGRATWNFAGGATSLDGSLFTADFLAASGGQSLTGPYRFPNLANAGAITFAFSDAQHGTMAWPGGTVQIERQASVPNGLTLPPQPGIPEGGWWWNPQESGRGFFIEWQGGFANIAGYMYDEQGRPTWYITVLPTPDPHRITGNWWTFANGQAMGQPYRPATRTSENAGALDVQFTSATTATMRLPDGRVIPLVRQAF